jgi:hypothetical protein
MAKKPTRIWDDLVRKEGRDRKGEGAGDGEEEACEIGEEEEQRLYIYLLETQRDRKQMDAVGGTTGRQVDPDRAVRFDHSLPFEEGFWFLDVLSVLENFLFLFHYWAWVPDSGLSADHRTGDTWQQLRHS